MALTPTERTLRARVAAHAMHSRNDSMAVSQAGRDAFLERFAREVDPLRLLEPTERERRAQHALRAHMYRLSLAASKARRATRSKAGVS